MSVVSMDMGVAMRQPHREKTKMANGMKIRIDAAHVADIEAALAAAQPRPGQNNLETRNVLFAAKNAEAALNQLGIAKSRRRGASYVRAMSGAASMSYRSAIATTRVELRRDGRGWTLVAVDRILQWPKARSVLDLRITREQSDSLADPKVNGYETFICRKDELKKLARFGAPAVANVVEAPAVLNMAA